MKIRYGVFTSLLLVFAAAGLLAQMGPGPMYGNADEIEFISKPSPTARVNNPYVYTAVAVSSDSTAVIRYHGYIIDLLHPTVLTEPLPIDSVTGVVNWTPSVQSWYEIIVLAFSNKGGRAKQEFNLLVSGGSGIVQGRVTDTLGVGLANVVVQALRTDITPMMGDTEDHDGGFFSYSARSDSNGYYAIKNVQPGSYKLHAISTSPAYASQWYDGQTSPDSANVITVADSDVTTINFVLRAGPAYHLKVSVAGSVTDTLGNPLGVPARVFFVRAGFALNSNASIDDFRQSFDDDDRGDYRMDRPSPFVFSAAVDSLGKFSLRIPVGYYVALAKAAGYATTFYLNQTDLSSATVINVRTDTANINFTMVPLPPVAYGSISGSVLDTAKGIGVRARVIAFRDHWRQRDDYRVAESYTTDTDSTGAYSFNQLLPGSYIIFAVPMGSYAPAFYTTDTASTRWMLATKLAVNGNSFTGIDIYVHSLPANLQGYTGINGKVMASNQSAVAGAFVYAMANGQVCGYGISGSDGSYSVSGLAPGTYSVTVDKAGFDEVTSQSATVTYNNTTSSTGTPISTPVVQTVNFSVTQISTSVPVSSGSGVVRAYSLGQNYPNPFNPSTTITYALPQSGKTTLKIYNILGQEVVSLVDGYQNSGLHQVVFNADKLSSGVYFYQLQSGSFVQSKKMVLLK